jgi:uncharacterized membrane protein
MPEPIESYVSLTAAEFFGRQARTAWMIGTAVVAIWVLLILLPPFARFEQWSFVSEPLYRFFSYICHQQPSRSFDLLGHQFGVCSRCFGVYFGLFVGFAAYPLWRDVSDVEPPPRFWLFLSLVPISVDWSLGIFGIWENTHASRFATGLILGFACGTYIVPAVVDIVRNLSGKPFKTSVEPDADA